MIRFLCQALFLVLAARFELAISWSQTKRINQTLLRQVGTGAESRTHSPFRMWSAQLAATTSDLTATIIGSMQYRVLAPIPGTAPGNL